VSDDLHTLHRSYLDAPTAENLHAVVHALKPVTDYALSSLRAGDDPVLRSKARVLTAKAVQSYDPSYGASLSTWTSNQMMPLRRMRRQAQAVAKVPDRIQLDAYTLMKAEKNFIDQHDRDPDVGELSDYAKMPVRRITKVRQSFRKMPSQAAMGDGVSEEAVDHSAEALDYIYHDADGVDRQILERKLGYGGKYEAQQPRDIGVALGLTPSQLSRRSAGLALRLQAIRANLEAL